MNNVSLTSSTLSPELSRWMIGFDQLLNTPESWNNNARGSYPPYNIVQRSEDHYAIELAVAGFGENDLSVTVCNGLLTVTGESQNDKPDVQYLHRGLSRRRFQREWRLVEFVDVEGVTVQNGIMTIELQRKLPDALKPRTVAINFAH
jgi:molecular chaperone IbpA